MSKYTSRTYDPSVPQATIDQFEREFPEISSMAFSGGVPVKDRWPRTYRTTRTGEREPTANATWALTRAVVTRALARGSQVFSECDLRGSSVVLQGRGVMAVDCTIERAVVNESELWGCRVKSGAFAEGAVLVGCTVQGGVFSGDRLRGNGVAVDCRVEGGKWADAHLAGGSVIGGVFEYLRMSDGRIEGGECHGFDFGSCRILGGVFDSSGDAGARHSALNMCVVEGGVFEGRDEHAFIDHQTVIHDCRMAKFDIRRATILGGWFDDCMFDADTAKVRGACVAIWNGSGALMAGTADGGMQAMVKADDLPMFGIDRDSRSNIARVGRFAQLFGSA